MALKMPQTSHFILPFCIWRNAKAQLGVTSVMGSQTLRQK